MTPEVKWMLREGTTKGQDSRSWQKAHVVDNTADEGRRSVTVCGIHQALSWVEAHRLTPKCKRCENVVQAIARRNVASRRPDDTQTSNVD